MSSRIRRLRRIVETMRPEVEAAIERAVGSSFFLTSPTPARLAAWRAKAHDLSAREAGYAYAAYGQLKIAATVEEAAECIFRLGGGGDRGAARGGAPGDLAARSATPASTDPEAVTAKGAREDVIRFLRRFRPQLPHPAAALRRPAADRNGGGDGGRPRRGRAGAARAPRPDRRLSRPRAAGARRSRPRAPSPPPSRSPPPRSRRYAQDARSRPLDDETDARLSEALGTLPKGDRRTLILAYLGYPYYDVATLPLLQGEGLDEFDPIKVDRISPNDAVAIRKGGPQATLKGLQFNSFGAFFSRAYRENDYLWGRLHGADRLIDIVVSTLPEEKRPAPETDRRAEARRLPRHPRRGEAAAEGDRRRCSRQLDREIG